MKARNTIKGFTGLYITRIISASSSKWQLALEVKFITSGNNQTPDIYIYLGSIFALLSQYRISTISGKGNYSPFPASSDVSPTRVSADSM